MLVAFYIVLIHYLADFIFQDGKWAVGKSKNYKDLLSHTLTYSLIWLIPVSFAFYWQRPDGSFWWCIQRAILFSFVTFVAHTITDYFTSRITSKQFANGKLGSSIPNIGAFSTIGFDQVLHYGQLFMTFWLLKQ